MFCSWFLSVSSWNNVTHTERATQRATCQGHLCYLLNVLPWAVYNFYVRKVIWGKWLSFILTTKSCSLLKTTLGAAEALKHWANFDQNVLLYIDTFSFKNEFLNLKNVLNKLSLLNYQNFIYLFFKRAWEHYRPTYSCEQSCSILKGRNLLHLQTSICAWG